MSDTNKHFKFELDRVKSIKSLLGEKGLNYSQYIVSDTDKHFQFHLDRKLKS